MTRGDRSWYTAVPRNAAPSVVIAGVADGPAEGVVGPSCGHGQHVANRQGAVDVVELEHLPFDTTDRAHDKHATR